MREFSTDPRKVEDDLPVDLGDLKHLYWLVNCNLTVAFEKSTFAKWLRDLVKLVLLSKSFDDEQSDDDGFARDVFTVTAKGALVQYARRKRNEDFSLAEPIEWMRRVHH